jgi:hypothetical protein
VPGWFRAQHSGRTRPGGGVVFASARRPIRHQRGRRPDLAGCRDGGAPGHGEAIDYAPAGRRGAGLSSSWYGLPRGSSGRGPRGKRTFPEAPGRRSGCSLFPVRPGQLVGNCARVPGPTAVRSGPPASGGNYPSHLPGGGVVLSEYSPKAAGPRGSGRHSVRAQPRPCPPSRAWRRVRGSSRSRNSGKCSRSCPLARLFQARYHAASGPSPEAPGRRSGRSLSRSVPVNCRQLRTSSRPDRCWRAAGSITPPVTSASWARTSGTLVGRACSPGDRALR